MASSYVAFVGTRRIARGSLEEVITAAKRRFDQGAAARVSMYDEKTGRPIDLNFGYQLAPLIASVQARLEAAAPAAPQTAPRGRGRPRLGVVSREVSLLPRHWAWLAEQGGGASAALRRLVEAARKDGRREDDMRRAIDAAHRFLWDLAGDLPGFEDATRALFARDFAVFDRRIARWPVGVRDLLMQMLADVREQPEAAQPA